MAYSYIGNGIYLGISSDTKPTTGVTSNSIFIETDTGLMYRYLSSTWVVNITLPASATTPFIITKPSTSGAAEQILAFKVSDDSNSFIQVENFSSTNSQFIPRIRSYNDANSSFSSYYIKGEIKPAHDIANAVNTVTFNVSTMDTSNSNAVAAVTNRPLYGFQNNAFNKFQIWNAKVQSLISHQFDNFADMQVISAPGNPATGYMRIYPKVIDSNNDGWFTKIKKNGVYEEVQII